MYSTHKHASHIVSTDESLEIYLSVFIDLLRTDRRCLTLSFYSIAVMTTTEGDYYLGVDVGTGSVRVSLFTSNGRRLASNELKIKTWRSPSDHRIFEQSTNNLWSCTCSAIRECLSQTAIEKEKVKGIGFDATCSLAVTNFDGEPILVSFGQEIGTIGERNVILWADHRAEKEAELINATGAEVLDYVGGKMSVCLTILSNSWISNY